MPIGKLPNIPFKVFFSLQQFLCDPAPCPQLTPLPSYSLQSLASSASLRHIYLPTSKNLSSHFLHSSLPIQSTHECWSSFLTSTFFFYVFVFARSSPLGTLVHSWNIYLLITCYMQVYIYCI